MDNAVIYARYSSHNQREVSLEDQIRECKNYATQNNLLVIKTYADAAITGKTDDRAQFQQMIKDAGKKKFSAVLCYKNDRFARNRFDAIFYKHKLKVDNGVKFIAVKELLPDGPGAIVMESFYESAAEMYSENLKENVLRGMTGNAMKCMANVKPPFGYKINQITRHYDLDERTAPIMTRVFDMAAANLPYSAIREYLASNGFARTDTWIYHALKNRRYMGIYIYRDIEKPGGMPRIVSDENFAKVQERIKVRKHKPNANAAKYLLSTRLYCGKCRATMCGEYGTSKNGRRYHYYKCSNKKLHHACDLPVVPAGYLEDVVLDIIKDILNDKDVINQIAESTVNYEYQLYKEDSEVSALKDELSDTEKRLKNMIAAIEQGVVTETTISRMKELEGKKNKLQSLIAAKELKKPVITKEIIVDYLKSFRTGKEDDIKYAEKLVDTFATRVYVFPDYVTLVFCADKEYEHRIDADISRCSKTDDIWWPWSDSNTRPFGS